MITLLTTGVFDLFHHAHVDYLKAIKHRYPISHLVVGIGTDDCIRRLKGPTRPFYTAAQRQKMLESCRYVDGVVIFNIFEDGSEDEQKGHQTLIEFVRPDIFLTGIRSPNQHVEPYLAKYQIPIYVIDWERETTTTQLVELIVERNT